MYIHIVPGDFLEVLGTLTQHGYRVLAVGHRPLHMAWHKAERVKRYMSFPLLEVKSYQYIYLSLPVEKFGPTVIYTI